MKTTRFTIAMLFLLSLFIPSRLARADMAPPPAPELGGLQPFQYQTTNVQMVYERVEMEIQPFPYSDNDYSYVASRVNVTAYFTMHNNGSSAESMQAIFPLESFSNCRMGFGGGNSYTNYFVQEDSFSALINGYNVSIQKVTTDHPYKVEGVCDQMTWAGFNVTFPVDEDVIIKVQYVMETMGAADSMQNIEYILETGAAWAGPIKRGYVIIKFPYMATPENVLSESTSGYQFLYNEAFWSFENLEPTSENNIHISIVSPDMWQRIQALRHDLKQNPRLPEKWLELAQIYFDIATWHWDNLRSDQYYEKISSTYETGIAHNRDNAELYAKYADFKMYQLSPRLIRRLTEDEVGNILFLLNKALALDPTNETAKMTLSNLKGVTPLLTFTPPPTIPATVTPLFTVTPSTTPSATTTLVPSATPFVVTVVHTKVVTSPASTSTATPRATTTSTMEATIGSTDGKEADAGSPLSIAVVGMLATFIAGIVIGRVWSKRTKKIVGGSFKSTM